MAKFMVRRLGYMVLTMWGVTVVVFLMLQLLPGDATTALLGFQAGNKEVVERLREFLGLDKPLWAQYWHWVSNILQGDLGYSIQLSTPVASVIKGKVINSLVLTGGSAFLMLAVGVPVGMWAALKRNSLFDRASMFFSLVLGAMPVFWLGLVLMYYFSLRYRVFPASGMVSITGGGLGDRFMHLVLPAITTSAISLAILIRVVRSAMLDVLNTPYMLALKARGIPQKRRVFRHAFRNILPPVVNMSGLQVGFLFGGAIFTEVIFSWPGIGLQLFSSIVARDIPMVLAATMVVALIFVFANTISDIVTVSLDPAQRAEV